MKHEISTSKQVEQKVNCRSCGGEINKNFCENCGEKRFAPHDLKITHYIEEIFEGFTHFDGKFFNSVRFLIAKPGLLSKDFCDGKRVPYMRPFALFFVCNLLFFLFQQNNIFSTPLSSFYNFWPFTEFHTQELINKIAPTNESMSLVSATFNEKMRVESKAFLVVFIPLLALGDIILRRKRYFSEHLIFSTHYLAFLILYFLAVDLLISKPFYFFRHEDYNETFDRAKGIFALFVMGFYYGIAAKRFYKISVIKAIFGSLFMMLIFLISLYGYRLVLFFKIIHSLH